MSEKKDLVTLLREKMSGKATTEQAETELKAQESIVEKPQTMPKDEAQPKAENRPSLDRPQIPKRTRGNQK